MLLTIYSPSPVDTEIKEPETIFDSEEWQKLESELDLFHDLYETCEQKAGIWANDLDELVLDELKDDIDSTIETMQQLLFERLAELELANNLTSSEQHEKAAILRKLDELA